MSLSTLPATSENPVQTKFAESTLSTIQGRPRSAHKPVPKLLLLAVYPSSALAAPAADGLDSLLAVVVYGAQEYPSHEAVEAVTLLSAAFVLLVGRGGLGALR